MKSWQNLSLAVQIPLSVIFPLLIINQPVVAQINPVACSENLQDLGADEAQGNSICANEPTIALQCATKVVNIGGTWDTAEAVCKNGTSFSGQCFESLINQGANWSDTTNLCQNALATTSQCVRDAQDNGYSWAQTISSCQPPSIADSLQGCINSLMYNAQGKPTGISQAAALTQCQRGRSFNR